jgi:hypothetical protein
MWYDPTIMLLFQKEKQKLDRKKVKEWLKE